MVDSAFVQCGSKVKFFKVGFALQEFDGTPLKLHVVSEGDGSDAVFVVGQAVETI